MKTVNASATTRIPLEMIANAGVSAVPMLVFNLSTDSLRGFIAFSYSAGAAKDTISPTFL